MRLLRATIAFALLSGGHALADVVSERPDSVAVTLYAVGGVDTADLLQSSRDEWVRDEGLAFISETRTIDLPAGPSEIRLRGVVSTMVPQSAQIKGLPDGVLEQDFDYDLLSPGSLLAKSIGRTVHLVRTDPKTGKSTEESAVVRSGPDGAVLEIDGKLEALHCSGLPERLVFDSTPEGLTDTPTLSVRTNAPAAGRYTITLSYIAVGLNWAADYVARIRPDGRTLDLSGWVTLANFSATGFGTIPLQVVAGNLQTVGADEPIHSRPVAQTAQCWPMNIDWATHHWPPPPSPPPPPPAPPMDRLYSSSPVETVVVTGSRIPDPRALGDYKLYTLPEPTAFNARQTKQVQFLDQHDVPFERIYTFALGLADSDSTREVQPATVFLRLQNRADAGLGKPLPAGHVSAMEPAPDGNPIFLGQASIKDMSVGLPVEISTGTARDVSVECHVADSTTVEGGKLKRARDRLEITISNGKPVPITFEFVQGLYMEGARIVTESRAHAIKSNGASWRFMLGAGEQAALTYTVEYPQD